ncbi:MAG: hypothetical protein OHM56_08095 [Spiroplasma phoeniceum]|nr:MAG: hypothetical protein OHM57_07500 [Spiroplasma phoeniceum]UZQ31587.1 MAG: hypothetical protein OHM56_08095 [Spiroplasma phoeniceum]
MLDETKLKSKTTKNIYQIIKTMYDKSIFSPTIFGYPKKQLSFRRNPCNK